MKYAIVFLLLSGCAASTSYRTQDHFTTPEPPDTVEAAIASAAPVVDDSAIVSLPYADPQSLRLGQQAPYLGVLISPFDAARYRLLDASADTWRIRAVTAEWQLARTERRDAAYTHALEDRVHHLEIRAQRRQRWLYTLTGLAAGGLAAAFVGR